MNLKKKLKQRAERAQEKTEMLSQLKEALQDEQMEDFIDHLNQWGFFKSLSPAHVNWIKQDLEDDKKHDRKYHWLEQSFCNNGMTVTICQWDQWNYIAIDPTDCYDSPQRSSVHAYFPMSKREYASFIKFFDQINGSDKGIRRVWMREAPYCLWGEYALFGDR